VSVSVPPPAAALRAGASGGQKTPNAVWTITNTPTARTARFEGEDLQTIQLKAIISAS
jgi:hypothetical protein